MSMLLGASAKSIVEKDVDRSVDVSWPSLFGRASLTDGASGDGECDPCEAACSVNEVGGGTGTSKRSSDDDEDEAPALRTIYGNATATEPWLENEVARWHVIEGRVLILAFDCDKIPNVCQNMCYGVHCKGFGSTLTISRATAKCQNARKKNSCGSSNPNRCSTKHNPPFATGNSCDEYPFASTLEGQQAAQNAAATRCVPRGENSSQGGSISGLYRGHADNTQFTVEFNGNAGSTGFCANFPNCAATGGTSQQ
ncbi:uncharacterized protein STEHIDRAFT_139844 [Stereum hirsutum FP-91666 SS1]|uniref:uncharacterized protein n=1 Tax=Stereum hirsutum (strain FP-91666) TaxID=721885 RepID=UPI000444A8C8|nr:uncharacterized protein STEHIDRAFT_139844 [Stereum hirsutum FP-91666 SS1]EIM86065.1 hypothetical protein STEHIDRAFT_139844 [Stereum hirsutum FP-91666 SS1]